MKIKNVKKDSSPMSSLQSSIQILSPQQQGVLKGGSSTKEDHVDGSTFIIEDVIDGG